MPTAFDFLCEIVTETLGQRFSGKLYIILYTRQKNLLRGVRNTLANA